MPPDAAVPPVLAVADPTAPPAEPAPTLGRVLGAALITTALVTAASYATPDKYAATVVGLVFLAATWWLVLRRDEDTIRAHGLSLGGLLEPTPLSANRLLRDALIAIAYAAAFALVVFPPFWIGYRTYWHIKAPFLLRFPPSVLDELAGQFLVIALPEEAFFRGYLQSSLDRIFEPRWRIFGASLGAGWIISAGIFAVGHVLTTPHPARLAVFFPALVFGWLRARTGGIGAAVLFHALCNLFSATLARGYGLGL
ncbi:MAG TPA: MrtC family glutamic-type intramembrane protease [Polyangiaceae bacterium]|nr:MrtC family glutamic-type intramembrane protease [Polyangiaceae bacterium]